MTSTRVCALVLCLALNPAVRAEERPWWDPRPTPDDVKARIEQAARDRGVALAIERLTYGGAEPVVLHGVTVGDAQGRPRVTAREVEVVDLSPLTVAVRDVEVPNPSRDGVSLKAPQARIAALFHVLEPRRFTVSALAPSGTVGGARTIPFRDGALDVDVDRAGRGRARFAARALDGRVAGTLARTGAKAPELELTLVGVSLGALAGKRGGETLDAVFKGPLPGSLRELNGRGRATLHGLSVDLSNHPRVVSMDRQARDGQTTTRIIGTFVQNDVVRGVAGMYAGQADYYRELASVLRRRHALGSAGGPLAVSRGVATISPFRGARLSGRLKVDLVSKSLSGSLSRVQAGRATLRGVSLSGSVASPRYAMASSGATLDGRSAPRRPAARPPIESIVRGRGGILGEVLGSGLFR